MALTPAAGARNSRMGVGDDSDLRLIKAWSHEFLHVSMMSAFVAMGCNGAVADRHAEVLDRIEAHLPEEPAVHRAIRQGLLELPERHQQAFAAGQSAYLLLATAIAAYRSAQSNSARFGGVLHVWVEDLARQWKSVANALIDALDVLDQNGLLQSAAAPGSSLQSQCPERIRQLLLAAARGAATPADSVDDGQRGGLPEWVERRRWHRESLNLPCLVTARGTIYEASIRNISAGGAMLDGLPPFMRLTPLTIEIEGRRLLLARVMWSSEAAIGVKFEEILFFDDPLLREPQPERDA